MTSILIYSKSISYFILSNVHNLNFYDCTNCQMLTCTNQLQDSRTCFLFFLTAVHSFSSMVMSSQTKSIHLMKWDEYFCNILTSQGRTKSLDSVTELHRIQQRASLGFLQVQIQTPATQEAGIHFNFNWTRILLDTLSSDIYIYLFCTTSTS